METNFAAPLPYDTLAAEVQNVGNVFERSSCLGTHDDNGFVVQDIFAGLISLIFIIDGVLPMLRNFWENLALSGLRFWLPLLAGFEVLHRPQKGLAAMEFSHAIVSSHVDEPQVHLQDSLTLDVWQPLPPTSICTPSKGQDDFGSGNVRDAPLPVHLWMLCCRG